MAKWLSARREVYGELYHVRQLLWDEKAKNKRLEERNSMMSQEIQTIGLELDAALKLIDEGL